jgi:hypothetical protein
MTKLRLLLCAVFPLAVILLGCAPNPQAPAKVSGSLTYKGQPIKGGSMKFYGADGVGYDAQISDDGTYTANDIPEGELVVVVETESINPGKKGAPPIRDQDKRSKMQQQQPPPDRAPPPTATAAYTKIPEKYSNRNTSPLTVQVKRGRQVINIDLTD